MIPYPAQAGQEDSMSAAAEFQEGAAVEIQRRRLESGGAAAAVVRRVEAEELCRGWEEWQTPGAGLSGGRLITQCDPCCSIASDGQKSDARFDNQHPSTF
jgi:hypothetical protein